MFKLDISGKKLISLLFFWKKSSIIIYRTSEV